jgi:hypothetical protein
MVHGKLLKVIEMFNLMGSELKFECKLMRVKIVGNSQNSKNKKTQLIHKISK